MTELKSYLIILFIVFIGENAFGQESQNARNTLYYEYGGTGYGAFSINYERQISLSEKVTFAPGLGFSLTNDIDVSRTVRMNDHQLFIPWQVNFYYGKTNHHLETGFGMPIALDDEKFGLKGNIYVLRFGYRYQPKKSGFLFRASLNPTWIEIIPQLRGGLSIGYSF